MTPAGQVRRLEERDTVGDSLVTSTRSPSNAAPWGVTSPLPVSVARIAPVEARTTVTEGAVEGTQMFVPSKTG